MAVLFVMLVEEPAAEVEALIEGGEPVREVGASLMTALTLGQRVTLGRGVLNARGRH